MHMKFQIPPSLKADFKFHKALRPLIYTTLAGAVFAAFYTARLCAKCPDIAWKGEEKPWDSYKQTDQYNVLNPNFDMKKHGFHADRPPIEKWMESK